MALEELLAAQAIGSANDRAGPPFDMAHHPAADRFDCAPDRFRGHRLTVAASGHSALSGWESRTPITKGSPLLRRAGEAEALAGAGAAFGVEVVRGAGDWR